MELSSVEDILREIQEGYNRRPKGWQMASDFRGNTLVLGPNVGYRLKTMMINPQENLGVAARIDGTDELKGLIGSNPDASCGLRPIDAEMARMLFSGVSGRWEDAERQELISRVLAIDPVPSWDLGKAGIRGIVGGPFLAHPDLRMVSKAQLELDERLQQELNRLFSTRYPMRALAFR